MTTLPQEKPKKSFEFRMSKKVAELTQVVHMLFTRNHEKEVEIDALKKAYEKEIELAIEDARGRISTLEKTIEEQSSQNKRVKNVELKAMEDEMAAKEFEWQRKMSESERLLYEERSENQNLRDLLINAQGDIEKLRQGVTDELSSKSDEIRRRDKEMERLANQLAIRETELNMAQNEAQMVISELQKTNDKLEEDVQQLHTAVDNSHKTRDYLMTKNKQLEHDMKALKREFNKKAAEMANNQLKNAKNNLSSETNLELERLRREVQRYRLELSNRDNNFNRMFTEKQPMLVNQRSAPSSKQSLNAIYTSFGNGNQATSQSQQPMATGNGNANTINHNVPNSLRDRQNTRTSLMELDRHNLDRQATFAERISSGDRILHNGLQEDNHRPQTHGASTFMHERVLGNGKDKHFFKQQTTLYSEEPHQLLPQVNTDSDGMWKENGDRKEEMDVVKGRGASRDRKKRVRNSTSKSERKKSKDMEKRPVTNGLDRPSSSSLPSICSTPERRKPLVKPKPLSKEMLYGK